MSDIAVAEMMQVQGGRAPSVPNVSEIVVTKDLDGPGTPTGTVTFLVNGTAGAY
jgi:hypothetical protein